MMGRLMDMWRRVRALGRRADLDRGLDEEIRFHLERQTEKNLHAGMSPDEARRQAFIRFGGVERAREGARDEFRLGTVEDAVRDLRHAARSLRRAPGFALVATVTLALGIGATTAMFSVVNGVLLRPLPYPEQDRLVELVHEAPGVGIDELFASPAVYFGYRDHGRTFEALGLWDWDRSPVTVTGAGDPESVPSAEVTHEVLPMLGATPIHGRSFTAADDLPGSEPTAIISFGYWQRRFGGADPLSQTLIVNGVPHEVIGVLPQSFRFFDFPVDIFSPRQPVRSAATFPSGDGRGLARVKPGVTLEQANADVVRMVPILDEEYPGGNAARFGFGPKLRWLRDSVVGQLGATLWLLMGTTGMLFLIACANVSNLVLVRTQARRPELALRTALGAGWAAVARVVLAESALLGLAGGLGGVAVAYAGLPFLLRLGADDLPGIMAVTIDPTVLAVALGTSVLATFVFALIPVVHFALPRLNAARDLRVGGRAATEGGRGGNRSRQAMVVAQVSLALALLVGCGLMIRTFITLRQVDPGFRDPAAIQTFQLTIPPAIVPHPDRPGTHDPARTLRMQHDIVERLAAVPGVESAGFTGFNDGLPLDGDGRAGTIFVEGKPPVEGASPFKEIQAVSPAFFGTMGTPVVAGREFDWNDIHQRRPVVIVSRNLADTEWGSAAAALGRRVRTNPNGPWLEVVGVAADVRHDGLTRPAPEMVIVPAPAGNTVASFVIRSARVGTTGFVDELRRAVWSVSAELSPATVQTMGDFYSRSMARTSMTLQLLAIIGTVALVLGLIGIYGIVSFAVAQRRREIGIRLAW
jgi:predicted permease